MNGAVAELERIAAAEPRVTIVPNPQQPPPQPDRPYVLGLNTHGGSLGWLAPPRRAARRRRPAGPQIGGGAGPDRS